MLELGPKVNPNVTLITTYNTFYLKQTNNPVTQIDALVMIRLTPQEELCQKFVTTIILELAMGKHLWIGWVTTPASVMKEQVSLITSQWKKPSMRKSLTSEYFPQHLTENTHQLLLLSNVIINSKLAKSKCSTHQKPIIGIAKILTLQNSNKQPRITDNNQNLL